MDKKLHLGVTYLRIEKTKTFSVWDKVNSVFWCKTVQLLGSLNKRKLFSTTLCKYQASLGGGGGGVGTPICFLPVTFLFLSQLPPNLVTFLKI